MITNYIKTSLRMLGRNKSYSFINIFGLAIGIASSILILLWVQYEYSYDHFAANHERIYQVKVNFTYNGTVNTAEDNCVPAYLALREADSRIKNTCITSNTCGHSIDFKEKKSGKEVLAVSKEFLEMFGIPILEGNTKALDEPYSIMLNESTAKELFGDQDPIGQYVLYDHTAELKVTGIFKDVPRNSTFWFHALVPIYDYSKKNDWFLGEKDKWDNFYPRIYAELQPNASLDEINANIKDLVKKHFNDGSNPELFLHAMDRWHLYEKFINGKEAGGKIEYVRLFMGIAILILLIACINYMNMATARSERRAKEVGIRKSIGSNRQELIKQFLLESFFITSMAFLLAIVLVKLSLPDYNTLVRAKLAIDFSSAEFWLLSAGLVSITSLISGCYPAFYFSSFQPIKVLKGRIQIGKDAGLPRKIMVASQYIISVFLVIGVVVIYEQIQHVKRRDLGYNQENLVMYAFNDQMEKNYAAIKNELLNSGVVESVTKSNEGIDVDYFTDYVEWSGKKTTEKIQFSRVSTEYDFIKTNGIRILDGRDFSPDFKSDSNAVLVNNTAVRIMDMKNPIGEKIKTKDRELTIIGVFEDVVRGSPFDPVAPSYVGMLGDGNNHLTLRLSRTDNLPETLRRLDAIFKKLDPMNIDEPMFVTERLTDNFRSINLISKLANLFAFLCIFLTCLGVLGLAAYTAEQRTKELAIRKILGANLNSLLWLLSSYFIRIVIVAILIAAPVSWWVLDNYLQSFPYRISIPWWTIPLTAIAILTFTLLIVLGQVIKAASVNPVNSLKSE
jgi:putative ABC transport system permease protein